MSRRVGVFVSAITMSVLTAMSAEAAGSLSAQRSPTISPTQVLRSAFTDTSPTAAQLAASKKHMSRRDRAWAARREQASADVPAGGVVAPLPGSETQADAPGAQAPGSYVVFRNSVANVSPAGFSSNINEPAVAPAGSNVFMTWNWYAALSVDGGLTWDGINPYADFPNFCCDQDTLYDRARDMILWYRQGIADGGGNNEVKLSRSTNGGATWCTYTISGSTIGFAGNWYDYPHLALSNDYVYITTNMFDAAGNFQRMVLMRWPLDAIQTCSGVSFNFWTNTTGWTWTPVQGAREVMYLGDQINSGGTFRIYTQPEANTTLTFVDRAIAAWTFTNRDGTCTVLGGTNPCARADQRITAGVLANNTAGGQLTNGALTFFWNVKQGGAFPFPYVEAATFTESTKTYIRRPFIWNSGFAFHWAAASSNARGDIGVTVYRFQPDLRPIVYGALDDDFVGDPPGWSIVALGTSAGNPSASSWGDYSRVRPYLPGGLAFGAAVYTKNASNVSEPRFVIFGRERDGRSVRRWWAR